MFISLIVGVIKFKTKGEIYLQYINLRIVFIKRKEIHFVLLNMRGRAEDDERHNILNANARTKFEIICMHILHTVKICVAFISSICDLKFFFLYLYHHERSTLENFLTCDENLSE
jgi:hypothetical protein